jgi:hypothetical protein
MAACAVTATYRHLNPFWDENYTFDMQFEKNYRFSMEIFANALLILFIAYYLYSIVTDAEYLTLVEIPVSFTVGILFGVGLCISGMCRRSKIFGFFTLSSKWDPSLAFVMAGAVMLNMITFNYFLQVKKQPLIAEKFSVPKVSKPDAKLVLGAGIFGIGWGICGMCPGPGMVNLLAMPQTMIWIPSLAAGQFIAEFGEKMMTRPVKQKVD